MTSKYARCAPMCVAVCAPMCLAALLDLSSAPVLADAPKPPGSDTRQAGATHPAEPVPSEPQTLQEAGDTPEQPPAATRPGLAPAARSPVTQPATAGRPAKPLVALEIRHRNEDWGRIVLELEPEKAPKTVANFLRYIEDGFYDGTIFHRIIRDFVAQGGGYASLQAKKEEGLREPIPSEADNGLKNLKGTIAAARGKDPHSARAQFFINLSDNPRLDHPGHDGTGYAVFGRVVEGMDVLKKIGELRTRLSRDAQRRYLEARRSDPTADIPRPTSSEPLFPATIARAYRIAGSDAESPPGAERRAPATEPTQPPEMPPPPPPEMEPEFEPDDELGAEERLEDEPLEEPEEPLEDPGQDSRPEPSPSADLS